MSKKGQNFTDNDKGVSPVIGMILILVIVTVSIGMIYSSGIPMLDNAKISTHIQNIHNSFSVLHNNIEEVVRGPITGAGTARTTEISMDGGTLAVTPNNTKIEVIYINTITTTLSWVPGTISYDYKGTAVIYENGAVFTKYPSGSIVELEPLIYAANLNSGDVAIMIHIINISGANSSTGGKGTSRVRTYATEEGFSNIFTGEVTNVSINITSQNYQAWDKYLNTTISRAGATYTSNFLPNDTVVALITNPGGGISLSIHETQIRSNVG
ncbi:MAG: hypothetical protein P1P80_09305 [ANME-2 cluster archaeon]|nr:hypothetical protein [ANME-2 cluster archaeon]